MTERKEFKNASTETELKEWATRYTQTIDVTVPESVRQVKEENRVLKQRVKRQSIQILNLKDLLKALRNERLVTENYEEFLSSHFEGNIMLLFRYINSYHHY